jgi:hypothetical protein
MTARVQHIAEEIRHLQGAEFGEFLTWLTDFEVSHVNEWDQQIEQDSLPGGRLHTFLDKVRTDIASGKTKGLHEVINNS